MEEALLEILETTRKSGRKLSARTWLSFIVSDRAEHLRTLNQYRFAEQRSCQDLGRLMEQLKGKPVALMQDLSRHVADEARHAQWLTELLTDLGAELQVPPGLTYLQEFEHLMDGPARNPRQHEDFVIASLAAINASEHRGCENFSAHVYVLKHGPQTAETARIQATIKHIVSEEIEHVRWGNRWLARIAAQSPHHRRKVEVAKHRYALIERAAYAAVFDLMPGAEFRRVGDLWRIARTMPIGERLWYFITRFPRTLIAPDMQRTRYFYLHKAWQQDPQAFLKRLPGLLRVA